MSRVYLRDLKEEDITLSYLNGFKDEDVLAYLEVEGKELTKSDIVAYIENGKKTGSYFMYAICFAENDEHIGNLKVGPINKKHAIADLVTVIWNKKYWGLGLGVDAIKEGNSLAFEKHRLRKLSGGIYESNVGSIKAYTRAGWIIEGRLQNHYMVDGKLQDRIIVSCFNPSYYKNE